MSIVITIVVVLAVVAIAQLLRVAGLSRRVSGKKEEEIDIKTNNLIGTSMFIFGISLIIFFFWLVFAYKDEMLPVSATAHGVELDWLMKYNLYLVSIVFVVFNFVLFYFTFKYRRKKGVKAYFYSHSNKLELIWTVIPSITMAVIIIAGLMIWWDITDEPSKDAIEVQIYGKQFDWTARYGGPDNKLGKSSFNFISTSNPLGLITEGTYNAQLKEIETTMDEYQGKLDNEIMGDSIRHSIESSVDLLKKQKIRILGMYNSIPDSISTNIANDDVIVKSEMYLPVDKEIVFRINSRDVIHSVFIPHFRLQMNAVPGMTTTFKFTPTVTTAEMQAMEGDENFDYVMMCNKICGASHYNMKMVIKVVSQDDYDDWLAKQDGFLKVQKELTAEAD